MEELKFATFDYDVDRLDPDVVILRCQDGSFVAVFEAAEEDRLMLIQAHANPLGSEAAIVAPVTEKTGQPWCWGRGREPLSLDKF